MMTDESSVNTQQHENADFTSRGDRGVRPRRATRSITHSRNELCEAKDETMQHDTEFW